MCSSNKDRKFWEGYSDHVLKQSDAVSLLQVNYFPKQLTSGQVCFTASRVSGSLNFHIHGLISVCCSSLVCTEEFLLSMQKIDVNTELGNRLEFLLAFWFLCKLITEHACLTPAAGVRQLGVFPSPCVSQCYSTHKNLLYKTTGSSGTEERTEKAKVKNLQVDIKI